MSRRKSLLMIFPLLFAASAQAQPSEHEYLAKVAYSGTKLIFLRLTHNLRFYQPDGDTRWGSYLSLYQLPLSDLPSQGDCRDLPARIRDRASQTATLQKSLLPEDSACSAWVAKHARLSYSTQNKALLNPGSNFSHAEAPIVLDHTGDWLGAAYREGTFASDFFEDFLLAYDLSRSKAYFLRPDDKPAILNPLRQRFPAYFNYADLAVMRAVPIGFDKHSLVFRLTLSANCMDSDMPMEACLDSFKDSERFAGYWSFQPHSGQVTFLSWDPAHPLHVEHTGYDIAL